MFFIFILFLQVFSAATTIVFVYTSSQPLYVQLYFFILAYLWLCMEQEKKEGFVGEAVLHAFILKVARPYFLCVGGAFIWLDTISESYLRSADFSW